MSRFAGAALAARCPCHRSPPPQVRSADTRRNVGAIYRAGAVLASNLRRAGSVGSEREVATAAGLLPGRPGRPGRDPTVAGRPPGQRCRALWSRRVPRVATSAIRRRSRAPACAVDQTLSPRPGGRPHQVPDRALDDDPVFQRVLQLAGHGALLLGRDRGRHHLRGQGAVRGQGIDMRTVPLDGFVPVDVQRADGTAAEQDGNAGDRPQPSRQPGTQLRPAIVGVQVAADDLVRVDIGLIQRGPWPTAACASSSWRRASSEDAT